MAVSKDVLRLVRTVERLPSEYQDKIMRIVDLLSLVPPSVQDRTQRMLREFLASDPLSKRECSAGVDGVIEYLEQNIAMSAEQRGVLSQLDYALGAKIRLS